jgi:hypothetical protein
MTTKIQTLSSTRVIGKARTAGIEIIIVHTHYIPCHTVDIAIDLQTSKETFAFDLLLFHPSSQILIQLACLALALSFSIVSCEYVGCICEVS